MKTETTKQILHALPIGRRTIGVLVSAILLATAAASPVQAERFEAETDLCDLFGGMWCEIDIPDEVDIPSIDGTIYEWVRWNTFFPMKVRVPNAFVLPVEVANQLDVPLVVTVSYSVPDTSVCSIAQQSTSQSVSSLTEATDNMVILAAKDGSLPTGEDDTATMRFKVTPTAPGTCKINVMADASPVGIVSARVGEQQFETEVLPELVKEVDLGEVEYNCALNDASHTKGATTGMDAATGERSVYFQSRMTTGGGSCGDRTFISHVEWLAPGATDPTQPNDLSSKISTASGDLSKSEQKLDLDDGTHTFKLLNAYKEGGWLTAQCGFAIAWNAASIADTILWLLSPITVGTIMAALLAIVFGGPVAMAIGAILLLIIAGLVVVSATSAVLSVIDNCSSHVHDLETFEVDVLAEDPGGSCAAAAESTTMKTSLLACLDILATTNTPGPPQAGLPSDGFLRGAVGRT